MSDKRLRELERRWKETGAAEDEAAFLRARVKLGDLALDRLRLAGHCGYEPALMALSNEEADVLRRDHAQLEGWAWGFEAWGREAAFRAFEALPSEDGDDSSEDDSDFWGGMTEEDVERLLANMGYSAYAAAMAVDSVERVQEAVAAQVVPWALGYGDPLPSPPWANHLAKKKTAKKKKR